MELVAMLFLGLYGHLQMALECAVAYIGISMVVLSRHLSIQAMIIMLEELPLATPTSLIQITGQLPLEVLIQILSELLVRMQCKIVT